MKILITGKNGFIGSHLVKSLSKNHDILAVSRNDLDLTNSNQTNIFFQNNNFDLIINTAILGGKTGNNDGPEVLYDNISMMFNLLNFKSNNTKLFNFSSGYELDKNTDLTANYSKTVNYYPLDYYGMSKNIISRISTEYPEIYTFRLFGVFGEYENENRFIKKNILNYINNQPITVIKDRYLDFTYIENIINVVEYYINNIDNNLNHFIDVVALKKYKLTETVDVINNLNQHKVKIIINDEGIDNSYIGSGEYFSSIIPNYISLEEGIKKVYEYIIKKNNL